MPVFRVTSPDGSAYDVTAPDGASEQDALAVAQAHHNALTQLAANSTAGAGGQSGGGFSSNMPPASNDNFPRNAACTTAGYECVQDGYRAKSCYDAERNCNYAASIFRQLPPSSPGVSATIVYPNGSTVDIPQWFDPTVGPKRRPPGTPAPNR